MTTVTTVAGACGSRLQRHDLHVRPAMRMQREYKAVQGSCQLPKGYRRG
jgi:hypothetical protein